LNQTAVTKKLDHIAIAVHSLKEAMPFYVDQLGLTIDSIEEVPDQGVRVAKLNIGDTHIELLEPLNPETPVGKFLSTRGPGLHHICLGVEDVNKDLSTLKSNGTKLIDETPKIGAGGAQIAFVHPRSTGGVLVELSQPKSQSR